MLAGRALGGSSSTATPASSSTQLQSPLHLLPAYLSGTWSTAGFTSSAATTTAGSQVMTVLRMLKTLVLRGSGVSRELGLKSKLLKSRAWSVDDSS